MKIMQGDIITKEQIEAIIKLTREVNRTYKVIEEFEKIYGKVTLLEEKDTWNLANCPRIQGKDERFHRDDIKTFIQKVREDIFHLYFEDKHSQPITHHEAKIKDIIDKRAGKL